MEYKVKLSQTFLPYLLVLIVIVGVTVYLDQLSETYSSEAEVIVVTGQEQSEQIALWQPELDETLPQETADFAGTLLQDGLQAYKQGNWQQARGYWSKLVERQPQAYQVWELLGRSFIKSHRYREALAAFQQSLAIDSTYGTALLNIGYAYAGLQQYHQAEAAYHKAAAKSQNSPLVYLNLGIVLSQQQRWGAALSELQKASALTAGSIKAKSSYYVGFAHLQLRDTLTALHHFQEAEALRPEYVRPQIQKILLSSASVEKKKEALLELGQEKVVKAEALVYYHLAELYQQHNNPAAAGEFLLKAMQSSPEDMELKIQMGKLYLQHNQLTQAEMLFKQVLNLDSLLPQPHYYLARLAAQKNDQRGAIIFYERAIASANNNFPEAYLGKGIAEESMNDTESAIRSYQQALTIWPDYPEAYYHMGKAHLNNDQLQQAVSAYKQALAVRPTFANAWYGLGLAYVRTNHTDSARLSLQSALAHDSELLNARMALGMLYSQEGNYKTAIAQYIHLLEQHPTYLPALLNLGEAYEQTGQKVAALETFERVVVLNPQSVEAKKKLAYLYATEKKTKKAVALYEELVKVIPYDHKLRFNLALQYEQQEKYKPAIVQLQKALELEPGYQRAARKLDDILERFRQPSSPLAYDN